MGRAGQGVEKKEGNIGWKKYGRNFPYKGTVPVIRNRKTVKISCLFLFFCVSLFLYHPSLQFKHYIRPYPHTSIDELSKVDHVFWMAREERCTHLCYISKAKVDLSKAFKKCSLGSNH